MKFPAQASYDLDKAVRIHRTRQRRLLRITLTSAVLLTLAACGGGGGGGGGDPAPPISGVGVSTSANASLSGTVTDDASPSPAPLAGATVSLYPTGKALAGLAPLAQATTAPNGTWSIAAGPAAGTYLLQIAPANSSHAALHKDVTLATGANAIGTTQLTILSAMEQTCIADFNQHRATLGVPVLTIDNAAMIAARAEAQTIAAWNGYGTPPSVTSSVYTANGGLGSITAPNADSGANGCAMAIGNMFTPGAAQTTNANPRSTWIGFGIAPDPIANSDYAAGVVTYP